MLRLCSFLLPNGQRCHCAANRGQDCCRHHTPEALHIRNAARPGACADEDASFSPHREWGRLRTWIMHSDADILPDLVENLMTAMAEGMMTPRTAGRLLLLFHGRREELDLRKGPVPLDPPPDFDAMLRQSEALVAKLQQALAEKARAR